MSITVTVEDMQRHPEHVPNTAGYRNDSWAIKFTVSHEGFRPKTFWRWHTPSRTGLGKDESSPRPEQWVVIAEFWRETFLCMGGFDFDRTPFSLTGYRIVNG